MSQNQCIIAVFNSFSNWVIELNVRKGPNQHLFASIAWNFQELRKEFAHRHFGFLQSCNELHSYTKIKTSKIKIYVYTKTEMPTIGIDSFDMHVYYMHRDVTFLMACINCWTHLSKLQLWHLVCCCILLWCVSSHTEIVVEYFCNLCLLHSRVFAVKQLNKWRAQLMRPMILVYQFGAQQHLTVQRAHIMTTTKTIWMHTKRMRREKKEGWIVQREVIDHN